MKAKHKNVARRLLHSGLPVPRFVRPVVCAAYRMGVFFVESWAFAWKLLWVEPVLKSVCAELGRGLRAERLPYMRGKGRLALGEYVNLSGRSCFYFMGGMPELPEIRIGHRTFIGNGCTLSAAQSIVVGDHCLLSSGVRIHDNDGHPLDPERRRAGERISVDEAAPVAIEDNVRIGACAFILKGVTIGENSVVGTGAVVTRDVPPNSIVAGNPAKIVGSAGRETTEVMENTGGGACIDVSKDGVLSAFLAGLTPEWVEQAGTAARRHAVEMFSKDVVVDAYLAYYRRVMAGAEDH